MDQAWTRILGNTVNPTIEGQLREMFQDTECLEKREFSIIHKIILQLVNLDLESLLQASTSALNSVDSNGRTALSWAAARGDEKAVAVLLKYRADPNIVNASRMAPLHYAMRAKSAACAPLLIKAGANINALSDVSQLPLHHAAAYQDDVSYLKCLIEADSDVNARDRDGYTALTWATFSNHANSVSYLLDHGADIRNVDKSKRSPLLHAVECKTYVTLEALLSVSIYLFQWTSSSAHFPIFLLNMGIIEQLSFSSLRT